MKLMFMAISAATLAGLCGAAEPGDPQPVATTGGGVLLRLKRPVDKSMIYEGSLDREQRGKSAYHSTDTFYVNVLCKSRDDGRDLLAMLRSHISRKRTEKYENSKPLETAPLNQTDLIDLGPNFETVGTLRCYPYDSQNRIAFKTMQLLTLTDGTQFHGTLTRQDERGITFVSDDLRNNLPVGSMDIPREKMAGPPVPVPLPHVFMNEAPHYMFPLLPERAVSVGDAWRFRVPLIIPLERGLAAQIAPTQFEAIFNGKLRQIRDGQAVIDYSIEGNFDSSLPEFKNRFTAEFLAGEKITQKISGTGTAVLDIERGWILDRHENFTFNFYSMNQMPPERKFDKKGVLVSEKPSKPAENKLEITSRFELKLLLPGTRLRSGAVVPGYE